MITPKRTLIVAVAGALTLGACTDPAYGPGGEREKTAQGAFTGALAGGILGAAVGDHDKAKSAAIGAAVGAGVGAAIGNQLDKQAAELRGGFSNGAIDVVNMGDRLLVRMPQNILFATDSTTVNASMQSDLRVLASSLGRYPNSSVQVVGHTDNTGSAAYNQDLSERRALAVTSILAADGVSRARLSAVGRGEDQPIASNLTADGRAQNRRVDIYIIPNR